MLGLCDDAKSWKYLIVIMCTCLHSSSWEKRNELTLLLNETHVLEVKPHVFIAKAKDSSKCCLVGQLYSCCYRLMCFLYTKKPVLLYKITSVVTSNQWHSNLEILWIVYVKPLLEISCNQFVCKHTKNLWNLYGKMY